MIRTTVAAVLSVAAASLLTHGCDNSDTPPDLDAVCATLCEKADACGYLESEDAETCTEFCRGQVDPDYEPCVDGLVDLEACITNADCADIDSGVECSPEIVTYRKECFERNVWGADDFPVFQNSHSETACCQTNDICGWDGDGICQCNSIYWDEGDCT